MRYPVMLDVAGQSVLVVGGGPIGARKVKDLAACGAVVTLVAPEISPEAEAAGAAEIERRPYRAGEAAGFRLVVAATGLPEVDGAVFRDAQAAGVWVNAADDPPHCSFILPAVVRRGPVALMVSTEGTAPALAAWLRDELGEAFGDELAELAARLGAEREALRAAGERRSVAQWRVRVAELAAELGVSAPGRGPSSSTPSP
jgi:siroheme synthase-like protein